MNNSVFIAGKLTRLTVGKIGNRDMLNATVVVTSLIDGKEFFSYIPVQITMPAMVEKYKNLAIGTRVCVEGRFETYQSNGKTGYNLTQLTSFQPIDEGDFNHATIWGRVTSDIRVNTTSNGNKVASFSVANTRSYKKDDEWVDVTSFIPVVAWNDVANVAEKLVKGCAVWITGKLNSRSYDNKDGQKVYLTEIRVDSISPAGTGRRNVVDGVSTSNNTVRQPQQNNNVNNKNNDGLPTFPKNENKNISSNQPPFSSNVNNKSTQKATSYPVSSSDGFINLDEFGDDDELPF